ncbi:MAG: DUF2339 domain-containing protein [Candidatus Peribacteraceae bacterium]|nr:DUF2339 domain-containing protein [Candidatus Peribacteraceae bacterium]
MQILLIAGIAILFILFFDLRAQVAQLRERLDQAPEPSASPQRTSRSREGEPSRTPVSRGPSALEQFGRWLKEDWLLKLGALLLLIGFGWLTTFAFLNNWIGPFGRIALGIVAGALILVLGFWRIQKYLHQGGIFLVLGSTVILLTIFAARMVYGFFTPLTALTVMFLSTAFVGFASVQYRSRALGLSSLILASIAPLLTHSPAPDFAGLFAYLLVVTLGAIWIAVLTQRRELTAAALIMISLYSIPHLLGFSRELPTLLLFAYAFAAAFYITNTAGLLKLERKKMLPDLITAAGNGLFLLVWVMVAARDEWKSLIISAWMIIFAAGAFAIFTVTRKREPFYVYTAVGIAMLAAATAAELEGATLTITYAIEGGLVAILAYAFLQDLRIALRTSLLLAGPVILSISSLTSYAWATGIIHDDFFVLLVLGSVLLGLGAFFWSQGKEKNAEADSESATVSGLLLITGSLYFYALLWLSLHATLQDDTAVMASLAIYTVIGLITHLFGKTHAQKGLMMIYGGVMLGFVVARLLLVDVWSMELSGRIITFFLVGALLISTAFIGRKKHA